MLIIGLGGVGDTDDMAVADYDIMKSGHTRLPYRKICLFVNPIN